MNKYIGIDIGGTNMRIASFDDKSLIKKTSLPVERDFDLALEKISEEIVKLVGDVNLQGIGIVLPGDVNPEEGIIDDSVNLPTWNKKPIKKMLQDRFKVDVRVDNDVKGAALAEYFYGSNESEKEFLFVIWGTGLGGTYVRKGEKVEAILLEIGHQILEWNGAKCTCGQHGCAEAYIGGGNAKNVYREEFSSSTSDEVWNKVVEKLGHAMINALHYFQTPLIVFSGGVASKQERLIPKVKEFVEKNLTTYPVPRMKLSTLSEDAGLYGALALIKNKQ